MYKKIALVVSILSIIGLTVLSAVAQSPSIAGLIENAKTYDGKTVELQGEAIGEVLERGQYAWVNISDGSNAAGVWMKLSDAQKLTYFGNYKTKGDTVKITGIFHNSCTPHDGELDIHADSMEIVTQGHPVAEKIRAGKVAGAGILLILAAGFLFLLRASLDIRVNKE